MSSAECLLRAPSIVTACEVSRVPREASETQKIRELPTAAELGGGRSRIPALLPSSSALLPLPPCHPPVCVAMLHSDGRGTSGNPRSSPEGVWAGKVGPCCQLPRGQVQSSGLEHAGFIQTEVPSSPWDSSNSEYQAQDTKDTNGWGFWQSLQQVPLMVAARATGLHKSTANGPRSSHWTGTATEPAGTLQRGRHMEGEGRQVFGQEALRLSAASLPLFCFPSLPLSLLTPSYVHSAPDLVSRLRTPLSKQVLGSCSPVSTAASHLWDSVSNRFSRCTLGWFHGAVLAHTCGLCWNCPDLAHLLTQWFSTCLLIFHTPHSP